MSTSVFPPKSAFGESPRSRAELPIRIERWPTEIPLLVVSVLISIVLWIVLVVTVIGLIYALFFGLFIFVVRVAFMAHLRGSGVRLGPDQFPELHGRVSELARRMGLDPVPETYIMQAGGALNAFATRFLGANMVVLYSDLLEACGDDEAARDMIIAHELGHVHAGHLRWHVLILPSNVVPFLGSALSRAREYTCDRYGLAGAGTPEGAVLGMTILAAGAKHGRLVNRQALVRQRRDLNTGWMTIGEWFASHPPVARRIAQLDPTLIDTPVGVARGRLRALGIVVAFLVLPVGAAVLFTNTIRGALQSFDDALKIPAPTLPTRLAREPAPAPFQAPPPEIGSARARDEMTALAKIIEAQTGSGRLLPWDSEELLAWWRVAHPSEPEPKDPFDGNPYGYDRRGRDYRIWSSGPDQESGTGDDIIYDSRAGAILK